MHAQYVAPRAIEPREYNECVPRVNTPQPLEHFRLEDQPGLGRTFIRLAWGRCKISQG